MRWLVLEPYYDGSHRQLIDGLVERVFEDPIVWTLPARKWKWRMRGAALEFAQRFAAETPNIDGIFVTSMCNAAELRALLPPSARSLPLVSYFHENQLTYPVQNFDARDHHFAWTNAITALAADITVWNSAYNRDSFLERLSWLARKMPDTRPSWIVDQIRERSRIEPVPIDATLIQRDDSAVVAREGPCHVVWNHRWEFDKGPESLMVAVDALVNSGLPVRVSIVGQRFQSTPDLFETIRDRLGERCLNFGFVEDRGVYQAILAHADVALSTAKHEFQGLAILEAAAAGAVPLVPDDLAYPEIWPQQWRYRNDGELVVQLLERVREVETWRQIDARSTARQFDWAHRVESWRELLNGVKRNGTA